MGKVCKNISESFSRKMVRLSSSWLWIRKGFEADFEKMTRTDLLTEGGPSEKIWTTKQKFVLKVHTPEDRVIAYKTYRYIKHCRSYVFRPAPTGLEALNYALLENLGLPMAKLLAVGETRSFFITKTAFLITEFVQGSLDGTAFLPGKPFAEYEAYKLEFCRKNLGHLAHVHNHRIIHNGTAPYNMLWKERSPEARKEGDQLEIIWIDVASCRKRSFNKGFLRKIKTDLFKFLDPFLFSPEEKNSLLAYYCERSDFAEDLKKILF